MGAKSSTARAVGLDNRLMEFELHRQGDQKTFSKTDENGLKPMSTDGLKGVSPLNPFSFVPIRFHPFFTKTSLPR